MKTPKRDCDWCNSWELEHCGRSWCGDCERGKRMFAQSSRWIRKNREARMRHALRKKDEFIDYAANVVQRMENEASDEYEHQLRLRLSLAATRTLNNFQRGYINASGTYGHNIEGS